MKRSIRQVLSAAVLVTTVCTAASFAGEGIQRNLVAEAEKLRVQGFEQGNNGNIAGALQSLSDCADILQMPEYNASNKAMMTSMVASQFGMLQNKTYKKRDWALTEKVLRRKVAMLEGLKQTDNNDYQQSLRTLNIVLKAQGKSTETQTLQAKLKPLKPGADKPMTFSEINDEPPPPAKE